MNPRENDRLSLPQSHAKQGDGTLHFQSVDNGNAQEEIRSEEVPSPGLAFFRHLLQLGLLRPKSAEAFLKDTVDDLAVCDSAEKAGSILIQAGLLTRYQLDRVLAGTTHGLVLGNYRVLERLGAGGMGVVFLGEHVMLNRRVAIKVLPVDEGCPPLLLERFYVEMEVLARLHHPNIVMAYDSGKAVGSTPDLPSLVYLAMEFVDGRDLEQYVIDNGPLPVGKACEWISQAACGLQEAHNHALIHRDIKPSNILLTSNERIKLVDFGLVRQFGLHLTDPKALLGTVEFMPPEQGYDPTGVSSQTDIYALGATLFWLLTGEPPYPRCRSISQALKQLQNDPPRRLRTLRPDAPSELEVILDRLLERNPTRRPAMPLAVKKHLEIFVEKMCPLSLAGAEQ